MRDIAERWTRNRWAQSVVYAFLFLLTVAVLSFPMTIYEGFYREHAYGLSNMSLQDWLRDFGIGMAIQLVIAPLLLSVIYLAIRNAPRTWWVWATGIVGSFLVLSLALAPVFIAPLFNEYKEMHPGPLKDSILSIARANGIPGDHVYQFDASRQSKRVSANVSGFMGTTRISLNDNLLNRGSPAEVKAVMAHEIGHYVLNHGAELIIYLTALFGAVLGLTHAGFGGLHRAFGRLWGVRDITDPAGFPILFLLIVVFELLATPIQNTIIRTNEAEADLFGLNAAREPDGFSTAILKLAEYRKLDPTPLEEFVFYDHPSGRSRITMAMQWKAEHLNDLPPAPPPAQPAAEPASPPAAEPVPQGPDPGPPSIP
jgi:STE24 endopeptidase